MSMESHHAWEKKRPPVLFESPCTLCEKSGNECYQYVQSRWLNLKRKENKCVKKRQTLACRGLQHCLPLRVPNCRNPLDQSRLEYQHWTTMLECRELLNAANYWMGETQNQANEIMGDPRDSEIRDRTIKKASQEENGEFHHNFGTNSIIIF